MLFKTLKLFGIDLPARMPDGKKLSEVAAEF
jgi:hypothetical protein